MKHLRKPVWIFCVFTVLLFAVLYGLWKWYHPVHKPKIWPGYTIKIPPVYTIHGIDVSRYQQEISWDLVKNMHDQGTNLKFVFIRAANGDAIADPMFEDNWDACSKYGLVRGAYHFFNPDEDALTQADFFINQVALMKGDLPPVLDIESKGALNDDSLRNGLLVWLRRVEAYYGVKPLVYCNIDFYKKYLRDFIDEIPVMDCALLC
ncbi:glycoside hydrolase family 25 protein [Chitinophagaceae bacterium MMS25-I14]